MFQDMLRIMFDYYITVGIGGVEDSSCFLTLPWVTDVSGYLLLCLMSLK